MPFMYNIEPAGNRAINQCKIMHVHIERFSCFGSRLYCCLSQNGL